ncbi:MAG: cation-translocating P-type ATPase [Spirochaetales bacterium]|nr:cation-translocating P-type ATPase [Leptospiraceae bacterium]MCP5481292.1 cation-translocating P-type ATPase [Spirochaetales bacterium]MCP5485728.1 cation-translocating P-type ATPase [Spirochaetales bacterium]
MLTYHKSEARDAIAELRSSPRGLKSDEAQRRLRAEGPNEIPAAQGPGIVSIFINQFRNFIVYILLFAVFFSALIGEYADTVIILIILLANAIIGFFQEYSAEKSLESLRQMNALRTRVWRDGEIVEIPARELVVGDVIALSPGDRVPADGRLLDVTRLAIEESALTGESVPVDKQSAPLKGEDSVPLGDQLCMVFSSSTVTRGRGLALVTATGTQTEIGKIATLVAGAEDEMTPLQVKLDRFGRQLGQVIIGICVFVFAALLFRDYLRLGFSVDLMLEFALVAVSLAVAAVPTALPTVVTVALSIGVKRLLHKKALVRRLSSVETLGSCDVICTDKTGTITANQMTVVRAWSPDGEAKLGGEGYDPTGPVEGDPGVWLFRAGQVCNNARLHQDDADRWVVRGEPTEGALLVSARKAGIEYEVERLDELPFDTARKRMSVLVRDRDGARIFAKGAVDVLLQHCDRIFENGEARPLTEQDRNHIEEQMHSHAGEALRVLGFAMREAPDEKLTEGGLVFLGLQSMLDPPRAAVPGAIESARRAGIRVIMITGDHADTARAVGEMVGIAGTALTGQEVATMSDAELEGALKGGASIFARVASEHKYRIVQALQRLGHTVAMTGDGINDAPALKVADIGVAVGSGTEVAREASDFVLLGDSFANITDAIEEGRGIYENIQKSIMLLLSGNFGEVLIIFLAVIAGLNLPLTAVMLLWINLVTDGAPALAFSVDPYGKQIMRRKPTPRETPVLPKNLLWLLGYLGFTGSVIALGLFYFFGGASEEGVRLETAQTMVFNFVVLYEICLVYIIRAEYRVGLLANRWMWFAVVLSLLLQVMIMYTDLSIYFEVQALEVEHLLTLGASVLILPLAYVLWRLGQRLAGKSALST